VQPRTVVILNNGAPVAMSDWIDGAAAVLEAWMMGQAGGGAIADVLFGRVNPSGKLAETFPLRLADTPAYLNFPGENGAVRYGEGIFIGYRYYDARSAPVLFPFGYGLSYTTFEYSSARVSSELPRRRRADGLRRRDQHRQCGRQGDCAGLRPRPARQPVAPEKELKGFAKVALQPGETKTVEIRSTSVPLPTTTRATSSGSPKTARSIS
jgi:beta-glucosidase